MGKPQHLSPYLQESSRGAAFSSLYSTDCYLLRSQASPLSDVFFFIVFPTFGNLDYSHFTENYS